MGNRSSRRRRSTPRLRISRRTRRSLIAVGAFIATTLFATALAYYFPGISHSTREALAPSPTSAPPRPLEIKVEPPRSNQWIINQPIDKLGSPPGYCDTDGYYTWVRNLEAIPSYNKIYITITAKADTVVVVTGLQVRVLDRKPALRGIVLDCPVGDAEELKSITVDLDKRVPIAELATEDERPTTHFDLRIKKGTSEVFVLWAASKKALVTWEADLILSVNGERQRHIIRDNTNPYRTTPWDQRAKLYQWDGSKWTSY
jgi:hypothetical protein